MATAALVFLVHAVCPVRTRTDSIWSIPTALSVLHRGDLSLDEYELALAQTQHGVEQRPNGVYGTFPIGAALVAVPFLVLGDAFAAVPWPVARLEREAARWRSNATATRTLNLGFWDTTEVLVASTCAALAALAFLVLLKGYARAPTTSFLVGVFAFGSPLLSTGSRALWQHAPAAMFMVGAVALAARWREGRWRFVVVGALAMAAEVCRPTELLQLVALLAFVGVYRGWRPLLAMSAGLAVVALPWGLVNQSVWGAWWPPYYQVERLEADLPTVLEALAGDALSPSRGVLVALPLLWVMPVAARAVGRCRGEWRALQVGALVVVMAQWVAVARFPHWWGGHSLGPRFFTEVVPWLLLPLAPWLDDVLARPGWWRRVALGLGVLCVLLHLHAAISPGPWAWNREPVDVDAAPARLWDWRDPQLLRW